MAGKMARWIFAAFALAGCAEMEKPQTIWATLDGEAPIVIAHRGASGYRPEHTLEAYALAIDQGADVIEPDLVFTKDGVLVARHDRYLSTTTDVADHAEFAARKRANDDPADAPREDWWVEDFTLAELKTLRARQGFISSVPGGSRSTEYDGLFEIPTFDEIIDLMNAKAKSAGRKVGIYPETKHPAFFASKGYDFEIPLLEALEGFDAGAVFVQSFEPDILKRLKGRTAAKLVQLVEEKGPGEGPAIPLEEIAAYADGVGPQKEIVSSDEEFTAAAHSLGLFVHPWTFRSDLIVTRRAAFGDKGVRKLKGCDFADEAGDIFAQELNCYFDLGVDGVFTDFPDIAVKVRSIRSSAEGR